MNLDSLIGQVATEVAHLSENSSTTSDRFRQQAAVSVLARVPVLLSSGIYSALVAGGTPPRGASHTLATGAGICGDHVALGLSIFESLGVPVRDVQIFYTDGDLPLNHTVVEVTWGGSWRMIDLTWGFIPHRGELASALSFEEASRSGHRQGIHHGAIPWRLAVGDKYDIFGYLTDNPDALFYDGSGFTRLQASAGVVPLTHPRIYRTGTWPHRPNVEARSRIELQVPLGNWSLVLECLIKGAGTITAGGRRLELVPGTSALRLDVSGPIIVELVFEPAEDHGQAELTAVNGEQNAPRASDGSMTTGVDSLILI